MKKLIFISRHEPTDKQLDLVEQAGYRLVCVGDRDAFHDDLSDFDDEDIHGAVVVNAAMALKAMTKWPVVGVFENARRPGVDGKPVFEAKALHLYRVWSVDMSGNKIPTLPEVVETVTESLT